MQHLLHPFGLFTNYTDLHQIRQDGRCINLGNYVPCCFRINNDQVVIALSHFPAQLSHSKDLFHSGCSICNEVKNFRQRTNSADKRISDKQPNVFAQRILGVHCHRKQIWFNFASYKLQIIHLQRAGKCTFVVHFHDQSLFTLCRHITRKGT